MDLALTYRCNNDCAHCYTPACAIIPSWTPPSGNRSSDRLWDDGIPHIIFTGGEPTLREDLPELIAYAESKGQITGINTNGRRLRDKQYVQQLVDAGLDHVQITLESHDAGIHDRMVCAQGAWQQPWPGCATSSPYPNCT